MAAIVFLKFLGPHLTMFNSLSIMRYIRQRLRKVVRRFRGFGRNSMKPGIYTQQGPIYFIKTDQGKNLNQHYKPIIPHTILHSHG